MIFRRHYRYSHHLFVRHLNIFVDVVIRCKGQSGHGSRLLDNTAGEKLTVVLEKFFAFRETQKKKLEEDPSLKLGDVTTVNLTIIEVDTHAQVFRLCYK